jgi:hypothetical protein
MISRNRLTVTLSALLVGWSTAFPVNAQNIQSPFGSRPFAPSGPQGTNPTTHHDAQPGTRPFAPPEPEGRGPDSLRDPLLRDLLRWYADDRRYAQWGMDGMHCAERKVSFSRLKIDHDTLSSFVRNGTIPSEMRKEAEEAAWQAMLKTSGRFADLTDADASAADNAACCRVVARGALVSMRPDCPGDR